MKTITSVCIISALLLPFYVNSQPEALDTTFGGTGMVQTDLSNGNVEIPSAAILQPDGKILVTGVCNFPGGYGDIGVVRYNPNGTLDHTFGENGKVNTFVSNQSDNASFIKLQPDGKILIGGHFSLKPQLFPFYDQQDVFLLRLNADGSIDRTFGDLGNIKLDYQQQNNNFGGAHIQADGNIITAIKFISLNPFTPRSGYVLRRFDINGIPDTTFGYQGIIIDTFQHKNNTHFQLSFLSDEKYLVATHEETDTSSYIVLKRYHINGVIDSTFGNNGLVSSKYLNFKDHFSRFLFQSDGKIFVIGDTYLVPGMEDKRTLLLRYNVNGQIDSTYGVNGRMTTPYEEFKNNPIFISSDQLLTSGISAEGFPVMQFNTDGTLDETFGVNGQIKLPEGTGSGRNIILKRDHKIIVVGISPILNDDVNTIDIKLVRYLTDFNVGVLDFENRPENVMIYPNPIIQNAIFKYTLLQAENITLSLYDLSGRLMQQFFSNVYRPAGEHRELLHFDQNLPSGCYILTLSTARGSVSVQVFK